MRLTPEELEELTSRFSDVLPEDTPAGVLDDLVEEVTEFLNQIPEQYTESDDPYEAYEDDLYDEEYPAEESS